MVTWATSSTARSNASWLAPEGRLQPLTLRTYCRAAARTSSTSAAGARLRSVWMFRHMRSTLGRRRRSAKARTFALRTPPAPAEALVAPGSGTRARSSGRRWSTLVRMIPEEPVSAALRDAKARARSHHYTVGTLQRDPDGTVWLECSCGTVLRNGPSWTLDEHVRLHLSLIHISEPTRLGMISYAVFCLKKKKESETRGDRE